MSKGSTTPATDTANLPIACPLWCAVDHEAGDFACQTARRSVVRVPGTDGVSTVHGFRATGASELRMTIGGKFFALDAAREYAHKILAVADQLEAV